MEPPRHPSGMMLPFPTKFKVMLVAFAFVSVFWIVSYFVLIAPDPDEADDNRYMRQISYNSRALLVYFSWFVGARVALCVPWIAMRVARIHARNHGFCRAYCTHLLLRDGPLYIFVLGSLLYCFHVTNIPKDEEGPAEYTDNLKAFAVLSNLVSFCCMVFAYWHNKLLTDAARDVEEQRSDRSAPPDTITKLQTRAYNFEEFGESDGSSYPADCPICLAAFEEGDLIKVTPCGHAFHEACLADWLHIARTCALCRRDLVELSAGNAFAMESEAVEA